MDIVISSMIDEATMGIFRWKLKEVVEKAQFDCMYGMLDHAIAETV